MTLSANQQNFSLKQHVAQSKIFFHAVHFLFPNFEFKVIGAYLFDMVLFGFQNVKFQGFIMELKANYFSNL
jgi:hypothetical protein